MLSNINLYNSLTGSQQTKIQSSEKIVSPQETSVTAKADQTNNDNLSLSTRAQKLSAITSEFFNGKPFASVDTAELIDRVYQYGLISKTEYATLSDKPQNVDDSTIIEPTSTQSLSKFIDRFKERLDDIDGYQESDDQTVTALRQALDSASAILDDVEQAKKSADFKSVLIDSKQTLTALLNSEEFSAMPLEDKVDMSNVIKTLDIVNKLSINRLDNPMINRYINVANY